MPDSHHEQHRAETPPPLPAAPAPSDAYETLVTSSRALCPETRKVMQTELYASWLEYCSNATQLNGEPFSDATRAHLKATGTGFLVHVFSRPLPLETEQDADGHLRHNLLGLTAEKVAAYIAAEGNGKKGLEAQLRSVLRTLVRPWLMTQGISPMDAFPTPETAHAADSISSQLSFSKPLADYLSARVLAGALSKEAAGNVNRITQRFLRFVYDLEFKGLEQARADANSISLPLDAARLEGTIRSRFDHLVDLFSSCSGPDAPQPSSSAASSVRSALNRHVRPVVLGEQIAQPVAARRTSPRAPMERPGKGVDANPEGGDTSRDAASVPHADGAPSKGTEAPIRVPAQPLMNVLEYNRILEHALTMVADSCKRPRADIVKMGINDIRIIHGQVRMLPPSLSLRLAPQWHVSTSSDLRAAIEAYQAARKSLSSKVCHGAFFISFKGESLVPPPVQDQSKKNRRK